MGFKGIYNLAMFLLFAVTLGVGFLLYATWEGMREENRERSLVESKLAYRIEKLKADGRYKREYYRRLVGDQQFADRVVKQKLGLAYPDEIVFRFDDESSVTVDNPLSDTTGVIVKPEAMNGASSEAPAEAPEAAAGDVDKKRSFLSSITEILRDKIAARKKAFADAYRPDGAAKADGTPRERQGAESAAADNFDANVPTADGGAKTSAGAFGFSAGLADLTDDGDGGDNMPSAEASRAEKLAEIDGKIAEQSSLLDAYLEKSRKRGELVKTASFRPVKVKINPSQRTSAAVHGTAEAITFRAR